MQIFDICTRKDYEKDGERKIKWYRVGSFKIADSGKKYIRLFHLPQIEFFVFDRRENSERGKDESQENSS
jgi:hypothetical protein